MSIFLHPITLYCLDLDFRPFAEVDQSRSHQRKQRTLILEIVHLQSVYLQYN